MYVFTYTLITFCGLYRCYTTYHANLKIVNIQCQPYVAATLQRGQVVEAT